MSRAAAALLLLAIAPGLAACGLHPLYAGGGSGVVARAIGAIDVGAIGGKNGWLMKNALDDRLHVGGTPQVRYRLDVVLDDQITGLGVRNDNAVTRERRSLRARYKLLDASSGAVLLDATAGSDAGIDVVSSEYATVAAEQTALENLTGEVADQIVARLALYAQRSAATR